MEKYTQKQLKKLIAVGAAIDVTNATNVEAIPEHYRQIGSAAGVYGCSGKLFQGLESGKLYAVTSRTSAIFVF